MKTNDTEELKSAISSFKLRLFQGIANDCQKCKRKGGFGSIPCYHCESGNVYILCGWCGEVTKIKGEKNGE